MFCQRCGAQLPKNTAKCPHCGAEYAVETTAAPVMDKKTAPKISFFTKKNHYNIAHSGYTDCGRYNRRCYPVGRQLDFLKHIRYVSIGGQVFERNEL